jgi:hypothetical protein
MTLNARARQTRSRPTAILLAVTCLLIPAVTATAIAAPAKHARGPIATAARILPPALAVTAHRYTQADRNLVARAKGLERCLLANRTHPKRCSRARAALQRAGMRLANVERRLARLASKSGTTQKASTSSVYTAAQVAPTLTVSGQKLSWNRVDNINTYVYVVKVPKARDRYSVVYGTSLTPPAVPGVTVNYSVRTTANGSLWAKEKSITYAPAKPVEEVKPPGTTKPPVNTKAAPELKASARTLSWNAVAGVSTYVLATKVPGHTTRYSDVTGTSFTPPAVPGVTVNYGLRTAVEGALWAVEVSVAYPASIAPVVPPPPPPAPEGPPSSGSFEMGENSGSSVLYELPALQQLSAHTARLEFGINTPVSQLEPIVEAYAKAGIRPLLLAGFHGRIPSTSEAQNLGSWAAAFGPGGTFWQGKNLPASAAVTNIEFGNETNDAYQFSETASTSNWYNLPSYAERAQNYALRFASAETAIRGVNSHVGLLAQGGDGGCGCMTWVKNMFAAVPDLASRVAGWTIHPYGPEWKSTIDRLISQTSSVGAPSSIPVYVTEWGLTTDNGRCLSGGNFGFNACMSYSQAASTLESNLAAMRSEYGSRLRAFYLYQATDQKPSGAGSGREDYFGALQRNGASKGAYTTTVESLLAANP